MCIMYVCTYIGIVTTTRVTHASPAGAYANVASREWENDGYITSAGFDAIKCRDIAHQLVHENPGIKFNVSNFIFS